MSIENKSCIACGAELNDDNWNPSNKKQRHRICKGCAAERARLWRNSNPEEAQATWTRSNRKRGMRPINENKNCSFFLGVHVAERVLSYVFKDVRRMPITNPGYDFICNHGKKIDVKSACLGKRGHWMFTIKHNTVADYFLCLAFDNRKDLNPLHVWLIPGAAVCHLSGASIRQGTLSKWAKYKIDSSKVVMCCNGLRDQSNTTTESPNSKFMADIHS